MKKLNLLMVFIVLFGFAVFGDIGEQEEIDFLLFFPNSSNRFVNDYQAMIQLDNLAKYLTDRNLVSGQISVYGYAAYAVNDIEPIDLSMDRALFVMNELQKRGVSGELFSDPVGYGAVDLWGSNANEADRSPNRRVRIMLDDIILTPVAIKAADSEVEISNIVIEEPARFENLPAKSSPGFPWKILLLLLILALLAAIIFFLFRKRSSVGKTAEELPVAAEAEAAIIHPAVIPVVVKDIIVNLEEEIRFRAYELYQQRNGQNWDMDNDWYKAVPEICARYEAAGYQVYTDAGNWWARKSCG